MPVFLFRAAASIEGSPPADINRWADALDAGSQESPSLVEQVVAIGRCLDALIPSAEVLRAELSAGRPIRDALLAVAAAGGRERMPRLP